MPKKLVIVESPAKANTINKILGKEYVVKASMGHVRDLPASQLAVDVENGFQPSYEVIEAKKKVIRALKTAAKNAEAIVLAADPDREGEAICWHLAHELRTAKRPVQRVTFNEITADAIRAAMQHPREIDQDLVDAQQARRVLDRLVGYQISPLLWRNVRRGLSAGRVQSVAVRLICQREEEIRAFTPEEYWTITARLQGETSDPFDARLFRIGQEKGQFNVYGFGIDEARAQQIVEDATRQTFTVEKVTKRERKQSPAPPFITSTLQQDASRKLSMTARRTMQIAQGLYEGVEIGDETVGLITYMRTDSTRVSDEALREVRRFVESEYGKEYKPSRARKFRTRKGAQDAHEAIRPTSVSRTPASVKPYLTPEQLKLYDLIWKRFVASQMSPAVLDLTTIDVRAGEYLFRATGSIVKFRGFRAVYMESRDEDARDANGDRQPLPELAEGDLLKLLQLTPKQHFTEPPPRYTEASLVKELEERGIGRPSTYAAIISTIQSREYVEKIGGRFHPTDIGELVTRMLVRSFPDILDPEFTARMESELDEIEEGKREWVGMVRDFYGPFSKALEAAADKMYEERKSLEEVTDIACEECGRPMAVKWGKFGKFLGCTGYPECRNTKPIGDSKSPEPVKTGVSCPECGTGELVQRQSRRRRIFFGCSNYPECKFVVWDPPVKDVPCPKCGAPFLTLRRTKTRQYLLCYRRKECGFKTDPEPVNENGDLPMLPDAAAEEVESRA